MSHPCPWTVGELMALYAIAHCRGDLVEVLTRRRKAA